MIVIPNFTYLKYVVDTTKSQESQRTKALRFNMNDFSLFKRKKNSPSSFISLHS